MKPLQYILWILLASCSLIRAAEPAKPNILLILADDVGFSDVGCYGGEIATPNLDSLAADGLRLTQFYNSARCSPSRAAILTGLNPHQAGFPNLEGRFVTNCVTIPEVIKSAGYRSTMVGKWHLNPRTPPTSRGFEDFYGMLGGFNTTWQEDPFYTRWPQDRQKRSYAPGHFYSTDVFADYAIDFIGDGKSGQPWFQYLAFNAAHFPLGAPEADIDKYEAMYFKKGWDAIRDERLARQKQMGLFAPDVLLPPRTINPPNTANNQTGWADRQTPAWDSLPEDRRHDLARRMAVYAAMVDHMDQAIGRVIAHLKATKQFDNTVIFFLSDNGACAEWDPFGFDVSSGPINILHTGDDLKKIGGPDSYSSYGSGWANACNTPFRYYKHFSHEGGVRTPFIVHWPAGLKAKGLAPGPGYITDFMPTVCAITGSEYPKKLGDIPVLPEEGISLLPAINGHALPSRRIFIEHEGNRSVRDGDWKLVALQGKPWELYNLATDPTETKDLAAVELARVKTLKADYLEWAVRCGVKEQPDRGKIIKKPAPSEAGEPGVGHVD